MADIGRNHPCPCGSGRKYKKCCLEKDEAAWRVGERQRQVRATVVDRLLEFADQPEFENDHIEAEEYFWADRLDHLHPADEEALITGADSTISYNAWFLFDFDLEEGRTPADLCLAVLGAGLDPDELAFLERMRRSFLSLYQVERIDPDVGLALVDLWTGARLFVDERLATQAVVQWDFLGARVVPDGTGRAFFEGGLYLLPVSDKDAILAHFRQRHRRFVKRVPGASDEQFFKAHGHEFNLLWLDRVVLRPPPRLQVAGGEDLIFSRVTFTVLDEPRLREVLNREPAIDSTENGSFAWWDRDVQEGRWLGNWSIESGRLRYEGWSREQAERARRWIEERAPTAIKHRVTSHKSGFLDAGPEPAVPREPTDDAAPVVLEYLDQYYHRWIDEPVPALDGQTPRQAAARPAMRSRVVDLLKLMENQQARGRTQSGGMPDYDFSWMWTELGLTRPGA